jgi:hypothetical protein
MEFETTIDRMRHTFTVNKDRLNADLPAFIRRA